MPAPGLHSLILYDNFEWKTAQKSHENYKNICGLTKIPALSLEEFETKFRGVLKENYHRKLNFRNLSKIDNLKLVLAGKSIAKSYKDLSETFRAKNIDFLDMDFWYYRFYNGNFDLDYDRRLDPKPLEFSNLPIMIHHKIIDNLDLESHLTLRRVSKSLRNIVDQGKPAIKTMTICLSSTDIIIGFDHFSARYSEDLGADYRKIALNHVMIILEKPKLRLDSLRIVSFCSPDPLFIDFLRNLKHKISTKYLNLDVDCPETTNMFVACMKPKFLEKLSLKKGNIDEIASMDQWKYLYDASFYENYSGSIDCFLGFPEFFITLLDLTEEHLVKLKEGLSKSKNFKFCCIRPQRAIRHDLIEKVFSVNADPGVRNDVDPMFQFVQYFYTVPNSGNILIMGVCLGYLMIGINPQS